MKDFWLQIKNDLKSKKNYTLISLLVSLILINILVRMPSAFAGSNLHWRVELFISVLLLSIFVWLFFKNKTTDILGSLKSDYLQKISLVWIAFIIWSSISVFWAFADRYVIAHSLTWLVYLVLFISTVVFLKNNKSYKPIITVFIFTAIILTVNSAFDFLTVDLLNESVKHPRIRYAKYAEMLVAFAPFLWILSVYQKKKLNFSFYIFFGAVAWLGVMLTTSKSGMLGGIVSFSFVFIATFLFSNKLMRRRILLSAGVWILLTVSFQGLFTLYTSVPTTTDFVVGNKDKKHSTTSFRVFTWKVSGVMIKDNLLLGVGANNFGIAFNEARSNFAKTFPNDTGHNTAEDHLVERAHNEYLQIFAELGIVGIGLFLLIIGLFGFWVYRYFVKRNYRLPVVLCGSLAGCIAFLISSMSSSFSFRLMQNGIVFFILLAVLTNELIKLKNSTNTQKNYFITNKLSFAMASVSLFAMITFSLTTLSSSYFVHLAGKDRNIDSAVEKFDIALALDKENAKAHFSKGLRLYGQQRMNEAAESMQKALDLGLGSAVSYSYLAETYEKAGKLEKSKEVLAKATEIFPHSIFIRVRYAILLEMTGKTALSKDQLAISSKFDKSDTIGWYNMIKYRGEEAFFKAREDENITKPHKLRPKVATIQYVDKPAVFSLNVD